MSNSLEDYNVVCAVVGTNYWCRQGFHPGQKLAVFELGEIGGYIIFRVLLSREVCQGYLLHDTPEFADERKCVAHVSWENELRRSLLGRG